MYFLDSFRFSLIIIKFGFYLSTIQPKYYSVTSDVELEVAKLTA